MSNDSSDGFICSSLFIGNHFINTSVQKDGIPGFPGCLEHSQMIWNPILSARRDKTELHVIWLDLANACCLVPHHLIRMALEFFNFPSKVGEIIMKYFNSAFMKFTVKNYTTKWQALEIGIMMGCVIFLFLFVLTMELILRGATNTSKGVIKNEHLTLPPSRAFMDDIPILVPSQTAPDGLLQRYYDLSTWARIKPKPKRSRSLSLFGGSVREIHFKIGGDEIPTVREKPVKSLGRLYSIPLESGFIYQFWKPTAPNVLTGRRIQNWESTPSLDDEGLSRRDHSEGVSRNKIRYEVVGR